MSYPHQQYAPDRGSIQTSAILLIVIGFLCGTVIPAIFGIVSLVQMDKDPEMARKMNRIGWIIFIVLFSLIVLAIIAYFLFAFVFIGIFAATAI